VESEDWPTPGFFGNVAAGASTFTANAAHLDGVVAPQVAAGSTASPPPYSVHVTGDVICGTTVSS
jgi:hypothetical protein